MRIRLRPLGSSDLGGETLIKMCMVMVRICGDGDDRDGGGDDDNVGQCHP